MKRSLGIMTIATTIVALSLTTVPAADAASGVTVSSSGPEVIQTYTYQDSTDGFITFSIRDAKGLVTTISQCDVLSNGRRSGCDTYPLEVSYFDDGTWRVKRTSGGWQVRVYVGYYSVSPDECQREASSKVTAGVELGALGSQEQELGSRVHQYRIQCGGFAAVTSGPDTLMAHTKRGSDAFNVRFTVLDAPHQATRAHVCLYSVDNDENLVCSDVDLASQSTRNAKGWIMTRTISSKPVSSRQCKSLKRNPASFEEQAEFFDGSGTSLGSVAHAFEESCR